MPANGIPSDSPAIHSMSTLPPPTLGDLSHWVAVRDSFMARTPEGDRAAQEMKKLLGPQRLGMAAHPSLPAIFAFVQERWGLRPQPARWWPNPGEVWVGLDIKVCLGLRDLLCQRLGLRPSEADRLPLCDVADHLCFRPIVPSMPPDGPEGGRWVWVSGKRHDVKTGVVYRMIAFMWDRSSAGYDTLEGSNVFEDRVTPQTIRARVSDVNRCLDKIGVSWRLKPNSVSRCLTKQSAS